MNRRETCIHRLAQLASKLVQADRQLEEARIARGKIADEIEDLDRWLAARSAIERSDVKERVSVWVDQQRVGAVWVTRELAEAIDEKETEVQKSLIDLTVDEGCVERDKEGGDIWRKVAG